jgi:beta-galactosidase/beta-glucuronidase
VVLNFGAVDYEATVFVNGKNVTRHVGGYWSFNVDITDYLNDNGTNEL